MNVERQALANRIELSTAIADAKNPDGTTEERFFFHLTRRQRDLVIAALRAETASDDCLDLMRASFAAGQNYAQTPACHYPNGPSDANSCCPEPMGQKRCQRPAPSGRDPATIEALADKWTNRGVHIMTVTDPSRLRPDPFAEARAKIYFECSGELRGLPKPACCRQSGSERDDRRHRRNAADADRMRAAEQVGIAGRR